MVNQEDHLHSISTDPGWGQELESGFRSVIPKKPWGCNAAQRFHPANSNNWPPGGESDHILEDSCRTSRSGYSFSFFQLIGLQVVYDFIKKSANTHLISATCVSCGLSHTPFQFSHSLDKPGCTAGLQTFV